MVRKQAEKLRQEAPKFGPVLGSTERLSKEREGAVSTDESVLSAQEGNPSMPLYHCTLPLSQDERGINRICGSLWAENSREPEATASAMAASFQTLR